MISITKISPEGNISLPKSTIDSLGFKPNDSFLIYTTEDTIILKKIKTSIEEEFEDIVQRLTTKALHYGINEQGIQKEIEKYRAEKRREYAKSSIWHQYIGFWIL